jgi:hypothetical protein
MPTQSATPDPPKPLPGFDKFCREMKPYLDRVRRSDVDQILGSLYRAAKIKVRCEEQRVEASDGVPGFRSDRKKMARAKALITKALKLLADVDPDIRWYLTAEREIDDQDYEFSFDDMVEFLTDAAESAGTRELIAAGWVHPDLRNKTEKQLAKKLVPGGHVAGELETHFLTARPKSKAVDQWFMGVAAKCLDQGRDVKGKKIPNYEKLINKAFEAVGDRMKTEGSIRKELTRQKKRPIRLELLDSEDEQWLSSLGQKSTRNRSGRAKLSGQKRRK